MLKAFEKEALELAVQGCVTFLRKGDKPNIEHIRKFVEDKYKNRLDSRDTIRNKMEQISNEILQLLERHAGNKKDS